MQIIDMSGTTQCYGIYMTAHNALISLLGVYILIGLALFHASKYLQIHIPFVVMETHGTTNDLYLPVVYACLFRYRLASTRKGTYMFLTNDSPSSHPVAPCGY